MKKVLQFSGVISAVLGIAAFILMIATHALVGKATGSIVEVSSWYSGTAVIFGKGQMQLSGSLGGIGGATVAEWEGSLSWSALLAFIFVIAAFVIVLVGVVLPLLKVKALQKFAGILNLIVVGLFIFAGIFIFIALPTFASANSWKSTDGWSLGIGWIFAAILAIAAGVVAILPAAVDFLGKKK